MILIFLLILKFDEKKNEWIMNVFSIFIEENSFFDLIKSISINADNEAKFSFTEIKGKKYLFSLNNKDNNPRITYFEINSKLSGISVIEQLKDKNENISENITIGNCVVNYFYHCFEKYPLIGAIQQNFNEFEKKKEIKLSFCVEKNYKNKITKLKEYITQLKLICQEKKKFHSMI